MGGLAAAKALTRLDFGGSASRFWLPLRPNQAINASLSQGLAVSLSYNLKRNLWNASISFHVLFRFAVDYRCAFYETTLQYIWRVNGGRNFECAFLYNKTYDFRATQLSVSARFCSTLAPVAKHAKARQHTTEQAVTQMAPLCSGSSFAVMCLLFRMCSQMHKRYFVLQLTMCCDACKTSSN